MESLRLSFESVAPIFLLMLLGYVLKNIKMVDKKTFDGINKLVFTVFLPVLLFYNIYKTEAQVFDLRLIAFTVIGVLIIFILGYFATLLLSKDNRRRSVILQGFFRSNYAILGVPLIQLVCGDDAAGLSSLMVAIVVPLFNVLAVFTLEHFRAGKISPFGLLKGVLKNPLIIGCLFGLVFFVLHIPMPGFVEKAVSDVAKIATPLAIVILGASFTFSDIRGYKRELIVVVLSRLVIVPLVMVTAAVFLGFRGEALACILIAAGAPMAVSSFSMTQQMGGDETLASQVIVISSVLCLLTLFVWIFVLSFLGFF